MANSSLDNLLKFEYQEQQGILTFIPLKQNSLLLGSRGTTKELGCHKHDVLQKT